MSEILQKLGVSKYDYYLNVQDISPEELIKIYNPKNVKILGSIDITNNTPEKPEIPPSANIEQDELPLLEDDIDDTNSSITGSPVLLSRNNSNSSSRVASPMLASRNNSGRANFILDDATIGLPNRISSPILTSRNNSRGVEFMLDSTTIGFPPYNYHASSIISSPVVASRNVFASNINTSPFIPLVTSGTLSGNSATQPAPNSELPNLAPDVFVTASWMPTSSQHQPPSSMSANWTRVDPLPQRSADLTARVGYVNNNYMYNRDIRDWSVPVISKYPKKVVQKNKEKVINSDDMMLIEGNYYYNDNSEFIDTNVISTINIQDLNEKYNVIKENNISAVYLLMGRTCNGIKICPLISKIKNVVSNDFDPQKHKSTIEILIKYLDSMSHDEPLDGELEIRDTKILFELIHYIVNQQSKYENLRFILVKSSNVIIVMPSIHHTETVKCLIILENNIYSESINISVDIDDGMSMHINISDSFVVYLKTLFQKYMGKYKKFDVTMLRKYIANNMLYDLVH